MPGNDLVLVYRFSRIERGRPISPQRMWGTLAAIAGLADCNPLLETAREVQADLLEEGFYFEKFSNAVKHIGVEGGLRG